MNEHIVKLFRLCRGIVGFWAPALLQIILGKLVSVAIRDQPKSPFISERLRVHPWLLWITNRNGIIFRVGDKQGSFCKITALSLQTVCAVRFSRKGLKILVGLLTGHNTLNRHLTLLKIEEDPVSSVWRRIWYQSTPSWNMQCSCWEMKKTVWKTFLISTQIMTGTLELTLKLC